MVSGTRWKNCFSLFLLESSSLASGEALDGACRAPSLTLQGVSAWCLDLVVEVVASCMRDAPQLRC